MSFEPPNDVPSKSGRRSPLSRATPAEPVQLGPHSLGGPSSLICVPLTAPTESLLLSQATEAADARPDVVEWRADYCTGLQPVDVGRLLPRLRESLRVPVLVTCRAPTEGGQQDWSDAQRLALLRAALNAGAEAIDVELATPGAAEIARIARDRGRVAILSAHDFQETPPVSDLRNTLLRQQDAGASVAKLAAMPREPRDVTRLLDTCLALRERELRIPLIAMSMGALGQYSRVVGPLYGIDLVFAVAVESSAPGQPEIGALRRMRQALGIP